MTRKVEQDYKTFYATGVATGAAYADVELTELYGGKSTEMNTGERISLLVRAEATTQDCNIKVLARPHPSYDWRELVAETGLTADTDTEVYADTIRDAQIKIQVKQGASPGGTVTIGVCLK